MNVKVFLSIKSGYSLEENSLQSLEISEVKSLKISENDFAFIYLLSNEQLNPNAGLWLSEDWFPLKFIENQNSNTYLYECSFKNLFPEDENFFKNFPVNQLGNTSRRFAKAFLNYFGLCEVFFDEGNESKYPILIGSIEITSSKISSNEIDNIFDFLLDNQASYWKAISRTKVKSSDNQLFDGHIFWLLYQLKLDLKKFDEIIPQLELEPRTKVVEKNQVENWNENIILDENSITWLIENCHVISKTDYYNAERVKINNRFFKIDQIQTQRLINTTDTYENRIIHGYLIDVKQFLMIQLQNIENFLLFNQSTNNSLRDLQIQKYYQRLKFECQSLSVFVDNLLYQCEIIIPVKNPLIEFPTNFHAFESTDHYFQLGVQIIRWFDRKNLIYDPDFLFSGVRTLDKLYELYCLFKIIHSLNETGLILKEFIPLEKENKLWNDQITIHAGKYIFNSKNGFSISLYYEQVPRYLFTSSSIHRGQLLPDFIVEFTNDNTKEKNLIILDAKYKPVANVKKYDVPALTLKYLHGISSINSTYISGLLLLHPKDKIFNYLSQVWFYHRDENNLFSEKPIFPFIGSIEIGANKMDRIVLPEIFNRIYYHLLKK